MKLKLRLAILAACLALTSISTDALAQKQFYELGIGVRAGEPAGLTLKAWSSRTRAVDAGAAFSFRNYDGAVQFYFNHLWHNFSLFGKLTDERLGIYAGTGGRIVFTRDFPGDKEEDLSVLGILGIRFPVGITFLFPDLKMGAYAEVAPNFNLVPATSYDAEGAIGLRIYF